MTAMQIYYSLKKLEPVNDVIFVNGELPEYMRTFIDQKMAKEAAEGGQKDGDDGRASRGNRLIIPLLACARCCEGCTKRDVLAFDVHSGRDGENHTEQRQTGEEIVGAPQLPPRLGATKNGWRPTTGRK